MDETFALNLGSNSSFLLSYTVFFADITGIGTILDEDSVATAASMDFQATSYNLQRSAFLIIIMALSATTYSRYQGRVGR